MSSLNSFQFRERCLPEIRVTQYLDKGIGMRLLRIILQYTVFFCIVLVGVDVRAMSSVVNEVPLIKNFTADTVGTTAKVWCLLESPDGHLYAGADRLLIFDGVNWTQVRTENMSEIRSLCLQGNRIWAGGTNEVGFFEKNEEGTYIYTSITKKLGDDFFGTVQQIYNLDGSIVVVMFRKIIQIVQKPDITAKITDFQSNQSLRVFLLNGTLYINQKVGDELKLWMLKDGVFEAAVVPFSRENHITVLLGKISEWWIGGMDRKIYAKNPDTGDERCIYDDRGDLLRAGLNGSSVCSGDRMYIGTHSGGYFVVDLQGNMQQVSKAQGLASDTCSAILPGRAGGVWVATDDGISFVQDRAGAGWIPLSSEARYIYAEGRELYVSCAQSAFLLSPRDKIELPYLLRAYWARANDSIYAMALGKLYRTSVGESDFKEVEVEGEGGMQLRSAVGFQGASPAIYVAFAASSGMPGIKRLDLKTGQTTTAEISEGLGYHLIDKDGRLWFRTGSGDIMMIDAELRRGSRQMTSRKRSTLSLHEGHPLVLFNDSGFVSVSGEKIANTENVVNALGTETIDGPAWICGRFENSLRLGLVANDAGGLVWKSKNMPGLRRFKNVTAIFRAGSDLWIGGDAGLIHVDTDKLSGPDFTLPDMKIVVRNPKTKEQRTVPAGTKTIQLTNSEQEVALHLETHVWGLLEPPQYESRLLPIEDEWKLHKYGEDIARSYVPTGQYTLQLRVRHLGETGSVTTFHLVRPLPWYFSYTGITLFGLVACLLFYGAVKLRTRQITARNRELEQKIVERTQELARANAAKSEFLAAMSHEIRNPMNGVIGIVKILQEAKLGAREKYYLTTLHRCAEQLRTTVDDVLDFSKIEAGAITLHPDTFDLAESINATISALDLVGDRLELASWAGPRPTVTGDQGKFCQILTNYFSNALKYGVPSAASIDVYVLNEGSQRCQVTVAVKNTGPDIPPHEQSTLFDTFTRGEYAKRGRIGGSGLGLSICKKFAETMGGSVGLTSSGGLTIFQVSVPFEIAQVRRRDDSDVVVTRSLNARALAIEDEDYNRLVLGSILAKLGYKVDWACDGKTALQLAQQNGYDLILTDLMLPDTDGGTLTREILKYCEEPKPPVFAVTAYSTKEKEDECKQAGMAGFISKPITVEKLEASLQSWASRHRMSAKPFAEPYTPATHITVEQLGRLGPLEAILPDFMRKTESEWAGIDRMLEDRECTPAANAAHKLISAMLLIEADVLSDQLRLLESRLRDGALESEIEKVRSICREEVANVIQALQAALARHRRFNADRSQT